MKLKPCPFCGADTAEQDSSNGADEVGCGSCQAYTWGDTKAEAIKAWNRRVKLIGPSELAEVLGLSKKTIYRWLRSGRIPSVKLSKNGDWLISREKAGKVLGISL